MIAIKWFAGVSGEAEQSTRRRRKHRLGVRQRKARGITVIFLDVFSKLRFCQIWSRRARKWLRGASSE
jgi:hypothetical protein